jgi:hypothetical protein
VITSLGLGSQGRIPPSALSLGSQGRISIIDSPTGGMGGGLILPPIDLGRVEGFADVSPAQADSIIRFLIGGASATIQPISASGGALANILGAELLTRVMRLKASGEVCAEILNVDLIAVGAGIKSTGMMNPTAEQIMLIIQASES